VESSNLKPICRYKWSLHIEKKFKFSNKIIYIYNKIYVFISFSSLSANYLLSIWSTTTIYGKFGEKNSKLILVGDG
jgi:hypothetical protein